MQTQMVTMVIVRGCKVMSMVYREENRNSLQKVYLLPQHCICTDLQTYGTAKSMTEYFSVAILIL